MLTNESVGKTVLMSVAEYWSPRAAAELIKNPEALAASHRGFAKLDGDEGLSLEGAFGARRRGAEFLPGERR